MDTVFDLFSVKVIRKDFKNIELEITLSRFINLNNCTIEFWAAAPPTTGVSFSGSGMPFHDSEQAYFNTPNKGVFNPKSRVSVISLLTPNSYYSHLGTRLIESCVNIKITSGNISTVELVGLGQSAPYRTLTYPESRNGPEFYDRSHLIFPRSQESICRDSGYPKCLSNADGAGCNNMISYSKNNSFWGNAVPSG